MRSLAARPAGPPSRKRRAASASATALNSSMRSRRQRSSTMPSHPGPERVENVRKIAVLRAGGLGDLVFALPALWALREAYPEAAITLLGGPLQTELLSGRSEPVERVITVPPSTGVNGPDTGVDEDEEELARFFRRMREERFDLALQMHGGGATPTRLSTSSGLGSRRARRPWRQWPSTATCPTSTTSRRYSGTWRLRASSARARRTWSHASR